MPSPESAWSNCVDTSGPVQDFYNHVQIFLSFFIVLDWGGEDGEGVNLFLEGEIFTLSLLSSLCITNICTRAPVSDEVIQEFVSGLLALKMGMYFCLLHISGL